MTSLLLLCNPVIPHTVARSKFIIPRSYSLHTTATELQLYYPSLDCVTLLVVRVQYNPSLDGFFWGRFFPQIPLQLCSFHCLHVVYVAHFLRHAIAFYSFLHLTSLSSKHFILFADKWRTRARLILWIYFFPHYFCAQIASCSQVLDYMSLPFTCSLENLLVSWGSLVSSRGPVLQQDMSFTIFKSSESWKYLFCYLDHVWTSSPRKRQAKQVPEYSEILNKQQIGAVWGTIKTIKRSTILFASNYGSMRTRDCHIMRD